MAENKYINITWDKIISDTYKLNDKLVTYKFDSILAVTRGGLLPATILSHTLNIKVIDTIGIASYSGELQRIPQLLKVPCISSTNMLIIDELSDTGTTATVIKKLYPKAIFATLYVKTKGKKSVDLFLEEYSDNTWLVFPWENDI